MEHGGACVHPMLGKPMRAAIGGGKAVIGSNVKVAAAGALLDVPLGHRSVSSNSPTARLTQPCIGFCWSKRVSPIDQRSEDAGEPLRAEIGTDPFDRVRAIARRRTVSRLGRRAARNTLLGPGHASLRGDSRAHAKQHKAALRWASAITAVQAAANIALPVLKLPAMPGMLG